MTSSRPVLVAYASKHGSTREVAEVIGDVLREHGTEADVKPAAEVSDLAPYGGVVLGGSLYFGRWHKDAVAFLRRHGRLIEGLPLAVFALGPKTSSAKDIAEARRQLDHDLDKVPEVEPDTVAVFGGVIDPTKLSFPLNRLPASDARDWDDIRAWAADIGIASSEPMPVA